MTNELTNVLNTLAAEFQGEILPTARIYRAIDIGLAAELLGYPELASEYQLVRAIVPLRRVKGGVSVEVSGSDLSDYVQLDSGIAVPKYVAEKAGLSSKKYQPGEVMLLNLL